MGNAGVWNCALLDTSVCVNTLIVNDDVSYTMVGTPTYWVAMTNCVWSGTAIGQNWTGGAPTGENITKVEKLADLKLSFDDPAHSYRITRASKLLLDKGTMDGLGYTAASLDFALRPRVVKNGMTLAKDPSALPDIGCYECQDHSPGFVLIFR